MFADKTSNIYRINTGDDQNKENIMKTYNKVPTMFEKAINLDAKSITEKIEL